MTPISSRLDQPCRNCGAARSGPYCSECGQRWIEADRSSWEILSELIGDVTSMSGRAGATLRLLFRHPRSYLEEWWRGRRGRYISPVRVYLLSAGLLAIPYAFADNGAGLSGAFAAGMLDGVIGARTTDGVVAETQAMEIRVRLERVIGVVLPLVCLLFLPMGLALWTWLLFGPRSQRLAQHLEASMAAHGFMYLAGMLMALAYATMAAYFLKSVSAVGATAVLTASILAFWNHMRLMAGALPNRVSRLGVRVAVAMVVHAVTWISAMAFVVRGAVRLST